MTQKVVMYEDRIGVLIGRGGETKKKIEELAGVEIRVNSETGEVEVAGNEAERVMRAVEIVKAINYGFSPEKAFRLLSENQVFHLIDLASFVGKDYKNLKRVKGRIIGEKGKAWRVIEETTKVYLSVYRHFVAFIGSFEDVILASEAVRRLINGVPHKAVYNFLFNERRREKLRRMRLWE